ncbi:c6 zinc finger domain-containing protein [Colletotrichum incanum]|uniref:C6 zinc finger domain-containing protein n=1 Tax=Colletotrichum incanum TaxID=1573173 RepID=A0A161W5W8_COLIC|nr:c6 zinc finger domain-containing protein [Colletotrichum incanum]
MSRMAEKDKSQPRRRRRERRMLVCLECHRRKLKCDKKRPCDRCVASDTALKCTYVKPGEFPSPKDFRREARQASPDGQVPDQNHRSGILTGDSERSSGETGRSPPHLSLGPRRGSPTLEPHNSGDSDISANAIPTSLENLQNGDLGNRTVFESLAQVEASPAKINCQFNQITSLTSQAGLALPSGEFKTYKEFRKELCQRRTLFPEDSQETQASIFDEFPARATADMLIDRYFDTFGSIFLFLHQHNFRAQAQAFWEQHERVSISDCIQILLVVAIGNATIDSTSDRLSHTKILRWWHLVLTWQNITLRSSPNDLHALQTGCLIEIMRQAYGLDVMSSWPASGLLVRNAMMAGLHRDRSCTGQLYAKEHQRQRQELWYTILELDLQSSMDHAMQPALSLDDWDMPLPNGFNPSDDFEGAPSKVASPRRILISTLVVRTRIAQFLNSIKCSTDYAEALKLHEELDTLAHALLHSSSAHSRRCDFGFANGLAAIYCQRSLLALHLPFAILRTPSYAYSYNICFSTALSVLERLDPPADQNEYLHNDGMVILMRTSGAIFRTVALQAILYLCLQMEASLKDHQPWTMVTELRDRFIAIAERYLLIAERRLTTQDFVGKAFIVPAMALAHAKLASSGMSSEEIASCDPLKGVGTHDHEATNFAKSLRLPVIAGGYAYIAGHHGWTTAISRLLNDSSKVQTPLEMRDAVFLVDVGGSIGHNLDECCRGYPQAPGRHIPQDLPHAFLQIQKIAPKIELIE